MVTCTRRVKYLMLYDIHHQNFFTAPMIFAIVDNGTWTHCLGCCFGLRMSFLSQGFGTTQKHVWLKRHRCLGTRRMVSELLVIRERHARQEKGGLARRTLWMKQRLPLINPSRAVRLCWFVLYSVFLSLSLENNVGRYDLYNSSSWVKQAPN